MMDGQDENGWIRHLECCVCLEVTRQPIRPWHQPPRWRDCGLILCPECFESWRATTNSQTCPRCRAELLPLDMFPRDSACMVDPVLKRLVDELLSLPTTSPKVPSSQKVPPASTTTTQKRTVSTEVRPPPPVVVVDDGATRPVDLEAMQRVAFLMDGMLQLPGSRASPEAWWSNHVVTTTTQVVDDREALAWGNTTWRMASNVLLSLTELDERLGWSRRLALCPEQTQSVVSQVAQRFRSPLSLFGGTLSWDPTWLSGPHPQWTCRVAGVRFLRTLVAALVSLHRWCREQQQCHSTLHRQDASRVARTMAVWSVLVSSHYYS